MLAGSAALMATSMGIAQADGPPPHGHVLVLGVEYDESGEPIGYDKCVELADGKALKLNAHHAHAHTGAAGAALQGAGHAVVPMAPLTPLTSCDDLPMLLE